MEAHREPKKSKQCIICKKEYLTVFWQQKCCGKNCADVHRFKNKRSIGFWYRAKRKQIKNQYDKEHYQANKEAARARARAYRQTHKNERNAKDKLRLKTDPKAALYKRIQTLLKLYLKRKGIYKKYSRTFDLLGYSFEDLEKHLQTTLREGMTWELFMRGKIHIDHITPHSWFKYQTTEEEAFKKCWGLSNLKLEWPSINCSKRDTYAG